MLWFPARNGGRPDSHRIHQPYRRPKGRAACEDVGIRPCSFTDDLKGMTERLCSRELLVMPAALHRSRDEPIDRQKAVAPSVDKGVHQLRQIVQDARMRDPEHALLPPMGGEASLAGPHVPGEASRRGHAQGATADPR